MCLKMSCNICSFEVACGGLGSWVSVLPCQQVETNSILSGSLIGKDLGLQLGFS